MFLREAFSFFFRFFLLFYSNLLALRGLPLESSETFQLFKICQFFFRLAVMCIRGNMTVFASLIWEW